MVYGNNSHDSLLLILANQVRTHVFPKHLDVAEYTVEFILIYCLFQLFLSVDLRIVLVNDIDISLFRSILFGGSFLLAIHWEILLCQICRHYSLVSIIQRNWRSSLIWALSYHLLNRGATTIVKDKHWIVVSRLILSIFYSTPLSCVSTDSVFTPSVLGNARIEIAVLLEAYMVLCYIILLLYFLMYHRVETSRRKESLLLLLLLFRIMKIYFPEGNESICLLLGRYILRAHKLARLFCFLRPIVTTS